MSWKLVHNQGISHGINQVRQMQLLFLALESPVFFALAVAWEQLHSSLGDTLCKTV
jgi:hypothetical protein